MSYRTLCTALAALLVLLALAGPTRSQPLAIASTGAPAPGGGTYAPLGSFIPTPVLLDGGDVAFAAVVRIDAFISTQRLVVDPASGPPVVLVQKGDAAPGTGGSFQRFVRVDGRGSRVTFLAEVTGPTVEGIFSVRPGDPVEAVVLRGDPAPPGGSYAIILATHRTNRNGDVAFDAALDPNSITNGLFLAPAGGPDVAMVMFGDPVPVTGGTFFGLSLMDMNDARDVVFTAGIDGGSAGQGIFKWSPGGGIEPLVLDTDPVPIANNVFSDFSGAAINDAGEVAFIATSFDQNSQEEGSLVLLRDGVMEQVAVADGPAPDGHTYDDIHRVKINASGELAFTARLDPDDWAFLTAPPEGPVQIAFKRGDPLPGVTPSVTVGGLSLRFAFGDAGNFATPVSYAQGGEVEDAIAVPEPAATAQVAAGALLLVGLARRARPTAPPGTPAARRSATRKW